MPEKPGCSRPLLGPADAPRSASALRPRGPNATPTSAPSCIDRPPSLANIRTASSVIRRNTWSETCAPRSAPQANPATPIADGADQSSGPDPGSVRRATTRPVPNSKPANPSLRHYAFIIRRRACVFCGKRMTAGVRRGMKMMKQACRKKENIDTGARYITSSREHFFLPGDKLTLPCSR